MNIQEILNGKNLHLIDDSSINKDGKRTGTINIADGESIGGNKWVAQVMPYGNDHGGDFLNHAEALAVGRLFAAAPDLLKAALAALECVDIKEVALQLQQAIDRATLPTARYEHDCKACIYLGQHDQHDLYFCPNEPTVIARYGNDGPEYTSGLSSPHHALIVAKHIAMERGLLSTDQIKQL